MNVLRGVQPVATALLVADVGVCCERCLAWVEVRAGGIADSAHEDISILESYSLIRSDVVGCTAMHSYIYIYIFVCPGVLEHICRGLSVHCYYYCVIFGATLLQQP